IICTNPVVSLPDARKVEAALKKAKFVVVQDISGLSDTVPFADLVLPAAGYMEKEGTMTNSDRRVSLVQKVVDAPGEALPDAEILWKFADKMGWKKQFDYRSYEEIYDEHKGLTKNTNIDVSGVSYKYLREKGTVQWPFPEGATKGVERLFTDHKFYTDNKKAKLFGVASHNESESLDENYPLVLTTGRIRDQWHTMTRTGKVNSLKKHIDKPYLEIHPNDALARGLQEGDIAEVVSRRGNVRVVTKITNTIREGVAFLPMHWGRQLHKDLGRANNLTNPLVDPFSKQPDFKFSAVEVIRYKKPKQKIVVVGAGAGANQFVESYRTQNQEDEIVVFSKEIHPFYNRVLLPEYISKHRDWASLLKLREERFKELDITVKKGTWITSINRMNKKVNDNNGEIHSYDKLVLATGSKAATPPNYPRHLEHVYTLRNRQDADRLNQLLVPQTEAVIVGGGLLGLELADSLNQIGVDVHLIQRSSRLMDRQLDNIAARLLRQEIEDKGVHLYFNDEISQFEGDQGITGVRLKSGQHINCKALIYAIGTRPNIGIGQEAGLDCNRGIVVNEQLQSSDPSIYCIGEIAEFNRNMWGITAAAEEQATVAAAAIQGDATAIYQGSLSMNILKVSGLQLCSLGIPEVPEDKGYEVVVMQDLARRYYKKCIIKNGKLVGAILMGNKAEFGEFRELIKDQLELKGKRDELLRPGIGQNVQVKGEVVCSCNNVGNGNIDDAISKGCCTLDAVMKETTAGTGCGSCKPEVLSILEKVKLAE
ncbi:MAG: FAD-dependent oxidoreductase, partial [Cyclobacteriaceae bacterium]